MHITLEGIEYKGSLLVWDYNKIYHAAHCLLKNTREEEPCSIKEKNDLFAYLESKGAEIDGSYAIMRNIKSFTLLSESRKENFLVNNNNNNTKPTPQTEVRKNSFTHIPKLPFFPTNKKSEKAPKVIKAEDQDKILEETVEEKLTIEYLTDRIRFPEVFNNTFFYTFRMHGVEKNEAEKPPLMIQSPNNLLKRMISIKNVELFEQKDFQRALLIQLFGILAPAYEKISPVSAKNPTVVFFQTIIKKLMTNVDFNGPTPYEIIPIDEQEKLFLSEEHRAIGIRKVREAQVQTALFPFYFFISDTIESQHLDRNKNPKVLEDLNKLKALVANKRENIAQILSSLEEVTYRSGVIATEVTLFRKAAEAGYTIFQGISYKLPKKENEQPEIESVHSCYFLLYSFFKEKLGSELKAESITSEAMEEIVTKLSTIKHEQIGSLHYDKKNFFILEKQKEALQHHLHKHFSRKDCKSPSKLAQNLSKFFENEVLSAKPEEPKTVQSPRFASFVEELELTSPRRSNI